MDKLTEAFSIWGDRIVNPRCDECGITLDLRGRNHPGAHMCVVCQNKVARQFDAAMVELVSQDRPDRRVHTVRLPAAMQREYEASRALASQKKGDGRG